MDATKVARAELTREHSFFSVLVWGAMCQYAKEVDHPFWKKYTEIREANEDLDIELTMLGHKIPLRPYIEQLKGQLDRMVEERAKELLIQKCEGLTEKIYAMEEKVKEAIREVFPDVDF